MFHGNYVTPISIPDKSTHELRNNVLNHTVTLFNLQALSADLDLGEAIGSCSARCLDIYGKYGNVSFKGWVSYQPDLSWKVKIEAIRLVARYNVRAF